VGSVGRRDTLKLSQKISVFGKKCVRTEVEKLSGQEKRCEAETESFPTSNKKAPNCAKTFQKVGFLKNTVIQVLLMSQHFWEKTKAVRTAVCTGPSELPVAEFALGCAAGRSGFILRN
jgi:hypothetical protein